MGVEDPERRAEVLVRHSAVGVARGDQSIVRPEIDPIVAEPAGDRDMRRNLQGALHERPDFGDVLQLVQLARRARVGPR